MLARRAISDAGALRELRTIDRVDGKPAALNEALNGATGAELEARLEALADSAAAPTSTSAAQTRQEARRILAGRRFHPRDAPRPLRGALRRLGEWLRPIARPFARAYDAVRGHRWAWVMAAAAVMAASVVVATRIARRRSAAVIRSGHPRGRGEPEDPDELERRADEAERGSELDVALRLRFRAGLLRLDRAGALAYRPSLTTGEVVRAVHSSALPALARAFEEVAYGGRAARAGDVTAARQQWPRVVEEAK